MKEVHDERENEHHNDDLSFLVLDPAQSPTHAVLELGSDPKDDEDEDLHDGETGDVDCRLFGPECERERVSIVPRLVVGLIALHERRRVLEQEVDEENAEGRVDENVEGEKGARIVTPSARDEVCRSGSLRVSSERQPRHERSGLTRDGNVRQVHRKLANDLLADVCEPDFPLPPRLFSHALDHETGDDDDAHDALSCEGGR